MSFKRENKLINAIMNALSDEYPGWFISFLPSFDDPDIIDGIIIGNAAAIEDYGHPEAEVYVIGPKKPKAELN